jgi:RNA polymerase sigma-70 factor, ECF subfamily
MNRPPPDALAMRLAELLAQCALKNQRAFADLYGLTSAKLYGVALRILRRQDWAEDVLQECYVNIWNHAGNYAVQKSAPLTWMTSIVRNRCLDWLRRPQTETTGAEYDVAVEAWQDDSPGPMEQLMAAGDAQALARCLRELEGKQRQSIMLAFFHGMTHTELAGHMKQPLGTVKTWVRRGLERLKGCLGAAT